jgi:hypothetical protein
MLDTKGMHIPIDVILVCIRWYAAYPLSYRHLEEISIVNFGLLPFQWTPTAGDTPAAAAAFSLGSP